MFNANLGALHPRTHPRTHPRSLARQAIAAIRRQPAPLTGTLSQVELRRIVAEMVG